MHKSLLLFLFILFASTLKAETPITLFQSFAGDVNFVGTEATRRTQPNTGNACAVLPATTSNSATITGVPLGATIRAAHLYWAGSYSTQTGSTRTTPDYTVRFNGNVINASASRQYTANYNVAPFNLDFFSAAADVTSIVSARPNPNGVYSFDGLSVNTAAQHCSSASVTAGWALMIVYESPSEDFRVVNLYEGFRIFRGNSLPLNSSNFRIPNSPVNGKVGHITWEGDVGNSTSLNGFSENLTFNGSIISDFSNPPSNQFNSVSTVMSTLPSTGTPDTNSYGVDFDVHAVDSYLNPGDTSATTLYSSGGDLVLLTSEIISVTNTPVSDLQVSKSHSGDFTVGTNGTFTIGVRNNGPRAEPGPIVVTDTLPTGLSFISATGSGWSCNAAGQVVTCNRPGSLAVGASTADITLTVSVAAAASPSVINQVRVRGTNFDNITTNNRANDPVTVNTLTTPVISLQKTSATIYDPVNGNTNPKAIPGALAEYTLAATNSGTVAADNNSIVLSDAIPANTALYVNDISGAGTGPVRFIDGTPPSGLSYTFTNLASTTDNVSFSNDGGTSFNYTPSPDASGVDTNVTHVRMSLQGQFLAASGSGNPNFQLKFRVKVQ